MQNLLQQVETDWTVSPPLLNTPASVCFCHTKTPTMHLERLLPTRGPFYFFFLTREFHVNTNQRHRKSNYLHHESECEGEEEEEGRTGCRTHGCRSPDAVQSALPLLLAALLFRRVIRSIFASNCCLTCGGRRQRVQPDCGESLPAVIYYAARLSHLNFLSVLKWESRRKNAGSFGFLTPSEQLLAAPEADGSLRRHHTQAERSHLISSFKSSYSAGQLD